MAVTWGAHDQTAEVAEVDQAAGGRLAESGREGRGQQAVELRTVVAVVGTAHLAVVHTQADRRIDRQASALKAGAGLQIPVEVKRAQRARYPADAVEESLGVCLAHLEGCAREWVREQEGIRPFVRRLGRVDAARDPPSVFIRGFGAVRVGRQVARAGNLAARQQGSLRLQGIGVDERGDLYPSRVSHRQIGIWLRGRRGEHGRIRGRRRGRVLPGGPAAQMGGEQ